ncbi:putative histone-lysine n-methyltransferase setmar [Nephila pilipes]|uniref:Putative histone-lysine n-methyltransferase setmar n=1 Tax=Nephila pilipes TaxID=299642 RepID=A0A8X6MK53_NEPPI|nr:putative histone-lysine n-methyltransferase setmar [Nephila pilipes]
MSRGFVGKTQKLTAKAVFTVKTFIIMEVIKSRLVGNIVKVILTVFFESHGVVHHENTPQDTTLTKEYYQEFIHRLRDDERSKPPNIGAEKSSQFHHDNAPTHYLHLILSFLVKNSIPVICQVSYSPVMAPWVFGYSRN